MQADADRSSPTGLLRTAESELLELAIEAQRAEWVYCTNVNDDTAALSSGATARWMDATLRHAQLASRLPPAQLSAEQARKVQLLRLSLSVPTPDDPVRTRELAGLVSAMQGLYAKGRHTPRGSSSEADLQGLSRILRESTDPAVLEDAWTGWHRVGRPMRPKYARYVELANEGARALGFEDTGVMWRSKYEMDPRELEREVDRLWTQVRPLYESLRTFVRRKLRALYGTELIDESGPLPAHLLGNMWAQAWDGILARVVPPPAGAEYDLSRVLEERKVSPVEMVRIGERFFDSLGFEKLPASFWERSMFVRPRDREVVCHASAWDIDFASDLRIKMCIEPTADDFQTVHHELGHNYYQRAYAHLSYLYRDGAHDGFHEAIGDAVALSVTPSYLQSVGLRKDPPSEEDHLRYLLYQAFDKIPFLPFGLVLDRWRWKVFSGEVGPEEYNRAWWDLKESLQGVGPPSPRGEEEFDAGAKFHIPANTSYLRYFLAYILQFQFHRAWLRAAGQTGPMYLGSVYGSRPAGEKLAAMLELGASRPWPDALEAGTGERRMDASALLEYFEPVQRWLDEQNRRGAA